VTILRQNPPEVKSYLELNLEAMRRRQERPYMVWLILRHLDRQGSGWVFARDLRRFMEKHRLCHRQTLWRALKQGEGKLWIRSGARLSYKGLLELALDWGLELRRHPVYLPIEGFGALARFRRALVASFFANKERIISHRRMGELVGRTARSVARYLAGIEKHANVMLTARPIDSVHIDLAKQGYFRTRIGDKWVLCKRLPNTYYWGAETAPFGLVKHGHTLLTDQGAMRRVFYDKPKAAGRAIQGLQEGERVFVKIDGQIDFWGAQAWEGWGRTLGMTAPC